MNDPGGVSAVLGRIQGIEARFTPPTTGTEVAAPPPPVGFEPFGEVYDQAVAARPTAQSAPTAQLLPTAAGAPITSSSSMAARPISVSGRVAAAIEGRAGPPGARPVGGYGAMPTPPELAAYGNGRVPAAALGSVNQPGSNHRLHAPAAASWNNLVAEAADHGFDLRITDSYRSYEEQVDLVRRKGLYSQGGYAAVPGTSNHGWGLAVDADVRNPDLQRWLQVNAPRFGWVESVPREPWHWEFRPSQV